MIARERVLRAVGSIAAGFAIAWEHLADRSPLEAEQAPVITAPWVCPLCDQPLTGIHVHQDDITWITEHDGAVLITDRAGGHCLIYNEAGMQ